MACAVVVMIIAVANGAGICTRAAGQRPLLMQSKESCFRGTETLAVGVLQ